MENSDHGTTYMRVGGDVGELRLWRCIYVYSIESRLIRRVIEPGGGWWRVGSVGRMGTPTPTLGGQLRTPLMQQ